MSRASYPSVQIQTANSHFFLYLTDCFMFSYCRFAGDTFFSLSLSINPLFHLGFWEKLLLGRVPRWHLPLPHVTSHENFLAAFVWHNFILFGCKIILIVLSRLSWYALCHCLHVSGAWSSLSFLDPLVYRFHLENIWPIFLQILSVHSPLLQSIQVQVYLAACHVPQITDTLLLITSVYVWILHRWFPSISFSPTFIC